MNPPALGTTALLRTPREINGTAKVENKKASREGAAYYQGRRKTLRAHHRGGFARSANQRGCGRAVVCRMRPQARITTEGAPGGEGRVYISGLVTCGSVWTCAVCSAKICRRRGEEVQAAIDSCIAEGGAVWMLTATIPHHAGHRLRVSMDAITQSWTYLRGGKPWGRWAGRLGLIGMIKGQEATNGTAGWHPHIHCLLFLDHQPPAETVAAFMEWATPRWCRKVDSFFLDTDTGKPRSWPMPKGRPEGCPSLFGRPKPGVGLRLTLADKAGGYLAKMGLGKEVSVMDAKGGRLGNRTPWQILGDHMDHQRVEDAWLWREWCEATKGRQHLTWGRGLRARLVPSQLELTDEEIVAREPAQSKALLQFERESWFGFQRASEVAGTEDFEQIACMLLEKGGPDGPALLVTVAQSLLRSAGIPGEVRYDPARELVSIEPCST